MNEDRERIVLTFDVGTQSSRALLINNRGKILGKGQQKHEPPYVSREPDWAEQDAEFYYVHICQSARELKKAVEEGVWERIEAVSITTIRDTVVCVDKEGVPLRPAIVWLDKRKADGGPRLSQVTRMMFKAVGMEETAKLQYKKAHGNGIMQKEPEIGEKKDQYVLLGG